MLRLIAVFTERVHWDEFVLLYRADATIRTGELVAGGRPGLGTLLLTSFAEGCRNAVDALVRARLLWTAMVAASVLAFGLLLNAVLPMSPYRRLAVATGVGLWVLAPAFVLYSIQVRTDQPAILFGLFGGLALLASRQRMWSAPVAGVLMGVGFLFSQKLLYVAGLVGVLALGQLLMLGEWRTRRELARATLTVATFLLVLLGYRLVMAKVLNTPDLLPIAGALENMQYVREFYGWRLYEQMLPSLTPQMLGLACLAAGTAGWMGERGRHGSELLVAWLAMLTGLVVLFVHGARLPYFYMVLGLFAAVVGALSIGPVLERLRRRTAGYALIAAIWIPLTGFGLMRAWTLTVDTQRIQRNSLAFVERNFPSHARGFQAQGAFVCRDDPDHFPPRFNNRVLKEFGGEEGRGRARELIQEFRQRPVSFLIRPYEQYPEQVWRFWDTRYVKYYAAVHVPGRRIRGRPGTSGTFEVIVPGEYKWRAGNDNGPLEIAGTLLEPDSSIVLSAGREYSFSLPEGGQGMIVLALPEPPSPSSYGFYTRYGNGQI